MIASSPAVKRVYDASRLKPSPSNGRTPRTSKKLGETLASVTGADSRPDRNRTLLLPKSAADSIDAAPSRQAWNVPIETSCSSWPLAGLAS